MKKEKKKKILIIVLSVLLGASIIYLGVYLFYDKDEEKPIDTDVVVEPTDKSVEDTFGTTKEEAIDVVKEMYNGDSYEFDAEIRADNWYVVTVTHVVDKTVTVYEVDPQRLYPREISIENE